MSPLRIDKGRFTLGSRRSSPVCSNRSTLWDIGHFSLRIQGTLWLNFFTVYHGIHKPWEEAEGLFPESQRGTTFRSVSNLAWSWRPLGSSSDFRIMYIVAKIPRKSLLAFRKGQQHLDPRRRSRSEWRQHAPSTDAKFPQLQGDVATLWKLVPKLIIMNLNRCCYAHHIKVSWISVNKIFPEPDHWDNTQ